MALRGPHIYCVVVTASLLLCACASTSVETTGTRLSQPLCEPGGRPLSTVVYWEPRWRPDQKEPQRREAAAGQGLREFLSRAGCLDVVAVHRLPAGAPAPSDEELWRNGGKFVVKGVKSLDRDMSAALAAALTPPAASQETAPR
ncbi:MAG TPA: hypothetical protein VFV71_02025 [Burkholderiales bacterium]|nr:hypothetical protein [Burkholderiales bacterium]